MIENNFIEIYTNKIPKEICQHFIEFFEERDKLGQTIPGRIASGHLQPKIKFCTDLNPRINSFSESDDAYHTEQHLSALSDYHKLTDECIIDYVKKYMDMIYPFKTWIDENAFDNGFFTNNGFNDSPLMHRYEPPYEGYHGWHMDWGTSNPRQATRMLVVMLYLNDVETGGETEFLHQDIKVEPSEGTVVIWPSSFTHIHKGNSPISNTKYIMNRWAIPINKK